MLRTTFKRMARDLFGNLAVAGITLVALPPLLGLKAAVITTAVAANMAEAAVHAAEKTIIAFFLVPTET